VKVTDWLRAPTGIDPVRAAGAFGALAGAGSLVAPYWTGLAEALCAVAALGWAMRVGDDRRSAPVRWGPAAVLAAAGLFAVLAAPPWSALRGLVLGVSAAVVAASVPRAAAFGEGAP
jgi:hypothetical protein